MEAKPGQVGLKFERENPGSGSSLKRYDEEGDGPSTETCPSQTGLTRGMLNHRQVNLFQDDLNREFS